MRKFKVVLEGKNLLLKMERVETEIERVEKHGVYIIRFVEAIDEVLAEYTALENFRCEPKWKALQERLLNAPDDPPIFEAGEITEVDYIDSNAKLLGLLYYPENPEDDAEQNQGG